MGKKNRNNRNSSDASKIKNIINGEGSSNKMETNQNLKEEQESGSVSSQRKSIESDNSLPYNVEPVEKNETESNHSELENKSDCDVEDSQKIEDVKESFSNEKINDIEIDFTSSWFIFSIFWFFSCIYNLNNDDVEYFILTLSWALISLVSRWILGKEKSIQSIIIGFVLNLVIWYSFEYFISYSKKEDKENGL
ncbi:MAG: Protein-export membrane protein SecF [Mycoplasmataceae bacterium]|nr:MAG: Protein-export membrane protein SecF [Mycoplasmataceae bacterium]